VIKEVIREVPQPVVVYKEVEKIVDRKVEVPFYQEKIVRVPEIVTQIEVERVEVPVVIEVTKQVDKIVEVTKIV